jgi:8-oxo-dGTP pyrophosphatase MutT (NUDIX family)
MGGVDMAEKTNDAAGFVLFNEKEEVLLVHQQYGKRKWALPGGVQMEGESAWQTAIRECKEEINIDIEPSECSLCGLYFLSHRNAYVYIFKAISWTGVPKPDDDEIDEIAYFSIDKLPSPMSNFTVQRIKDAAMNNPTVVLREQHVRDYIIGDPQDFG